MPLKSELSKNLTLLMISLMVSLVLGEILLRIFVPQETKRLACYDKDLGWRGTPNGKGVYIRKDANIFAPFLYNNQGFRDEDFPAKGKKTKNILLLGDSFLESLEVEYEKIFCKLLEDRLQENINPNIEIVAISSQGYSTAQQLLAYRKFQAQINPEIVMLMFYSGNDFQDNGRRKFAFLDGKGNLQFPKNTDSWVRTQYYTLKRWIYENSHLVFFLKNLLVSHLPINLSAEGKEVRGEEENYEYRITDALILAFKEEVEKNQTEFSLVIISSRNELAKNDFSKVERLVNLAKKHDIPCLDLSHALTEKDYFKNDVHFVDSGHFLVADQLYRFLVEEYLAE